MEELMYKLFFYIILFIMIISSVFANTDASGLPIVVISNINSWRHPTKDVFEKYNIVIQKVALLNNGVYPVFYAAMPGDPQLIHNDEANTAFLNEVAMANSWWDFSIIDNNMVKVDVKLDKRKKKLITWGISDIDEFLMDVNSTKGILASHADNSLWQGESNGVQVGNGEISEKDSSKQANKVLISSSSAGIGLGDFLFLILIGSGAFVAWKYLLRKIFSRIGVLNIITSLVGVLFYFIRSQDGLSKCRYCNSNSYGSCLESPSKKHEHNTDENHCIFCGSTAYGGCLHSPCRIHRHGNGNKCVWCGSLNVGGCVHSPHGQHEK